MKHNRGEKAASPSESDPMPGLHVVVLIHGIRTQAEWQQRVEGLLKNADPEIRVVPARYGYFDLIRFLLPFGWIRRKPVEKIKHLIRNAFPADRDKLSVIAHSFGTYIVGKILVEESDIRFYRVILCGSILPEDYDWVRVKAQLGPGDDGGYYVVNECGTHDIWPVLARAATFGYGSSGRLGFHDGGRVRNRFHTRAHSEFFTPAFVNEFWSPFLVGREPPASGVDREKTPWWLSALTTFPPGFPALVLLVIAVALGVYLARPPAPVPPVPLRSVLNPLTGKFLFPVSRDLRISAFDYAFDDCEEVRITPVSRPGLTALPIEFDEDERAMKIRTDRLVGGEGGFSVSDLPGIPWRIKVSAVSPRPGHNLQLHILTDDEYVVRFGPPDGQGRQVAEIQIGGPGFAPYIDQTDARKPVARSIPGKYMLGLTSGPLAVLILSAEYPDGHVRQSEPFPVLRSGVRAPDDDWTTGGVQLAYVDTTLPPLVIFQSRGNCSQHGMRGVFASTLDGSEIFRISPRRGGQYTLSRVNAGPPPVVYFRGNFETGGDRVCYAVTLARAPVPPPTRVSEDHCPGRS